MSSSDATSDGHPARSESVNMRESNDVNDWRWMSQDEYLAGVELQFLEYTPTSDTWDHDHCAFCWAKFLPSGTEREWSSRAPGDTHDLVTEGYTTTASYSQGAKYVWICQRCFDDFDHLVDWMVSDQPSS